MRSFRIAVCLSGQARTWKVCQKAIQAYFDVERHPHLTGEHTVQTDYFIHTWDKDTWRRGPDRTNRSMFDEPVSELSKIKRAFSAKAFEVSELNDSVQMRPWDGLFYSFMRSVHLKRMYEIENHFEYDVVVKARLDTVYPPDQQFPLHRLNPLMAYTSQPVSKFPREYHGNDFHDVIFYGDSPTMDLASQFYRTYSRTCTPEIVSKHHGEFNEQGCLKYGPGTFLYRYLISLGIHPECYMGLGRAPITYTVVREQAVERGLDPIKDYKAVRDIYLGWYR